MTRKVLGAILFALFGICHFARTGAADARLELAAMAWDQADWAP